MRWEPGSVILWCYRHEVAPVRIISDDDRGVVVWLAPGTPVLRFGMADGRPVRDRPLANRFTDPRVFVLGEWVGAGIVRVGTPGLPYSAWLFRQPDGEFWGWYANLEAPMRRGPRSVHSRDHVLDVWMDADGAVHWKDEDEFAVAVEELNRFSAAEAEAIRAAGVDARDAMLRGAWPFDRSLLDWRPDPRWTTPELPPHYARLAGTPAYDLFPDDSVAADLVPEPPHHPVRP